jgi:hypothetical protein
MVEVLQRAVVQSEKDTAAHSSTTPIAVAASEEEGQGQDEGEDEDEEGDDSVVIEQRLTTEQHAPSLHKLASLYLKSRLTFMLFNACAMLHFTSLLIGYALAWSKAFCQVLHCLRALGHTRMKQQYKAGENLLRLHSFIHTKCTLCLLCFRSTSHPRLVHRAPCLRWPPFLLFFFPPGSHAPSPLASPFPPQLAECEDRIVIAPFVILFSLGLVIFARRIQPLVSTLTSFKCVMLIVMVAVVGYIGVERTRVSSTDDYSASGAPFLIGTIALGGVVNVMPVLFESVPMAKLALQQFRSAIIAGVVVCYVLNLLWAYFILRVVPQTAEGACYQVRQGKGRCSGWVRCIWLCAQGTHFRLFYTLPTPGLAAGKHNAAVCQRA